MPVKKVGANCYQWGDTGKKYCGKGAALKAARQGKAAYSAGYKRKR